jgi:hypothetical protein
VGSDGSEQPGADSRHSVQRLQSPEGSTATAVGDDGLGERQPHTRKPGQLGGARAIGVDPLTRRERPGERQDAVAVGSG